MNKIYLIANWKMNLTLKESVFLAHELIKVDKKIADKNIELIICPSCASLYEVGKIIKDTNIRLGAQDVFYEDRGPYAGETSALMLKEVGCEYVIVGHSSRRQYLGETDEIVNKKIKATLRHELVPIICVGENQEEKQQGKSDLVAMQQVDKALAGIRLDLQDKLIIAYEPIWAIGTGQTDFPGDTQHVANVLRQLMLDIYSLETMKNNLSIIYGGSITAESINTFIIPGSIDGVLVGGASQKIETFLQVINKITPLKLVTHSIKQ